MAYLYETHMHTSQASKCGHMTGADHAAYYKAMGYQGIIVTDHFYGGNTCIDRSLPWDEWVGQFCKGYEDAKKEGDRIGLDVFFGWEQGYGDDEYLIYGLDKDWLLQHEEIKNCSRARQLELVHEGGGCVVQAHPFRIRGYMTCIRVGKDFCDGIEAANAGNEPMNDVYAMNYGLENGFTMTAGSDNHNSEKARERFGILLPKRMESLQELVSMVRNREQIGIAVPPERFIPKAEDETVLESYWVNAEEGLTPTGRTWRERAK